MLPTNVLIIDDSKLITKLVTKALLTNEINNHLFKKENIYIAHDGMQAFEILGKNSDISLVISDVMMPILNGEELIEILIDIDKINNLDLFFITTPNVANNMNKLSKEHSAGVVTKPFNDLTFCTQINKLQVQHKKKLDKRKHIKTIHNRQKRHITLWIHEYLKKKSLEISHKVLNPLIESEFKHFNPIDDSELFMIATLTIENYFSDTKQNNAMDVAFLEDIYNSWNKPEEHGELGLVHEFSDIINNAKKVLNKNSTKDDVIFAIIQPISSAIIKLKNRVKSNNGLSYDDFFKYFPTLIEIFFTIDNKFQKKEINTLIGRVTEIQKAYETIKVPLSKERLTTTFSFLEQMPKVINTLNNDVNKLMENIEQRVIPLYINEIETIMWKKAKKSPKIVSFLKQNLKKKMPNTHNLLYHCKKLSKDDMKQFVKYEKVSMSVISNDMPLLNLFKNSLQEHLPLWKISVYTNISIFQHNIENKEYKKLIIDLNFKDSVFNNGLQLLKQLQKRYPYIQELVKNNAVYLLASTKQVELLHDRKDRDDYTLLVKPINEKNIYEKIFWES